MNPIFLFVLFALGFVFGLLLKNPTAGKFLIFGFVGVFVYEPVRDAGLVASAAFVTGIISHHITLYTIYDMLPSWSGWRRRRAERARYFADQRERSSTSEQNTSDYGTGESGSSAEQSSQAGYPPEENRFSDDGIHHRRGYTSRDPDKRSKEPNSKKTDDADRNAAEMRRERERLEREKARLDAERRKFDEEKREKQSPPDNRSDEEILGVSGDYTLADLKKARNAEVKRWNTSNMINKPAHLVREAEEEAKKINLAYEKLLKKSLDK